MTGGRGGKENGKNNIGVFERLVGLNMSVGMVLPPSSATNDNSPLYENEEGIGTKWIIRRRRKKSKKEQRWGRKGRREKKKTGGTDSILMCTDHESWGSILMGDEEED